MISNYDAFKTTLLSITVYLYSFEWALKEIDSENSPANGSLGLGTWKSFSLWYCSYAD